MQLSHELIPMLPLPTVSLSHLAMAPACVCCALPAACQPRREEATVRHAAEPRARRRRHSGASVPLPVQVLFNPQGSRLVTASADHTCKVWALECDASAEAEGAAGAAPEGAGCMQTLRGHADEVFSLAMNYDGGTLASASKGVCHIWRTDAGGDVE